MHHDLFDEMNMNELQRQTLQLQKNHKNISATLVCQKLKCTYKTAEELCEWAWGRQAREWFFRRNFGKTEQEFLDEC